MRTLNGQGAVAAFDSTHVMACTSISSMILVSDTMSGGSNKDPQRRICFLFFLAWKWRARIGLKTRVKRMILLGWLINARRRVFILIEIIPLSDRTLSIISSVI